MSPHYVVELEVKLGDGSTEARTLGDTDDKAAVREYCQALKEWMQANTYVYVFDRNPAHLGARVLERHPATEWARTGKEAP